jgi:hypothetical protein
MVQFEDSLRQRSEIQISIRSSYSEKIFYEMKKFDDLWAVVGVIGSGSSVGMIMVQFEDSLRQKSEVQISIRSSDSEKIFYEMKKYNDLWAHYHGLHSQPSDTNFF